MSWLSDLFNPPAANIPPPQVNTYNPGSLAPADASAFGGIGNLGAFNTYASYLPQMEQYTAQLTRNPYAGDFTNAAVAAATLGQQGATGAFNQGQTLYNQAPTLFGLGNTVANTAFDPQSALYNRTLQQLQDQTRAGQEARGIATTPYGAGLENQALNNFNIDWQNQQLQRQIQGAQAAGGLFGQGAGLINQGAALQAGAPGQYYGASALPYNTYQSMATTPIAALQNLAQFGAAGANIPQQQVQDYLSYLGWGSGALNQGNAAKLGQFNAQLAQDKQAFGEQQSMFGGLGNIAGGATNFFFPGGLI